MSLLNACKDASVLSDSTNPKYPEEKLFYFIAEIGRFFSSVASQKLSRRSVLFTSPKASKMNSCDLIGLDSKTRYALNFTISKVINRFKSNLFLIKFHAGTCK